MQVVGNEGKTPKGLRAREANSQEDLDAFLPKEASAVWNRSAQGSKKLERFLQTICKCQHHFGETGLLQEEEVAHQTMKVPFLPLSTDSSCTLGLITPLIVNLVLVMTEHNIDN